MKGLEPFSDLLAVFIGMAGALLKGLKNRLYFRHTVTTMIVAGILTFSVSGVIELFYEHLSPKLIILISFIVGWGANELTEKIDLLIDDVYEYFSDKLKPKNNGKD